MESGKEKNSLLCLRSRDPKTKKTHPLHILRKSDRKRAKKSTSGKELEETHAKKKHRRSSRYLLDDK